MARKVEELDGVFQCNRKDRELIIAFEDPNLLCIDLWDKKKKFADGKNYAAGPMQSIKLHLDTGELELN